MVRGTRAGGVLLAAGVAVAACAPDRPERLVEGTPASCAAALRAVVAELGRRGPPISAPPDARGVPSARIPVGEIGDWVLWNGAGPDGRPSVQLVVDGRAVRDHSAVARCGAREPDRRADRAAPPTEVASPRFADADLRAAEAEAVGLVVYIWSPHMPLSVDGYREIASAARSHGLGLEPVLFRGTDRGFAGREAARAGIPREGLREVASVELVLRDAQVHAPSIVVFQGGRVSPVLPGYRDADGYRRWLAAFLR